MENPETTPEELKVLGLRVPVHQHRWLKDRAKVEGETMEAILQRAIDRESKQSPDARPLSAASA